MKQIIVEVRGGVVQAVYSNDTSILVNILDHDDLAEATNEDEKKAIEKLLDASKLMTQVY